MLLAPSTKNSSFHEGFFLPPSSSVLVLKNLVHDCVWTTTYVSFLIGFPFMHRVSADIIVISMVISLHDFTAISHNDFNFFIYKFMTILVWMSLQILTISSFFFFFKFNWNYFAITDSKLSFFFFFKKKSPCKTMEKLETLPFSFLCCERKRGEIL